MISILTFCRGQGCLLLQGVSLLCRYPTTQRQTHSHTPTHTQTHTNTQTDTHSYSFTYIIQVLQSTAQVMHVCGNKFEAKRIIDLFTKNRPHELFILLCPARGKHLVWLFLSSFSPKFLIIPVVVRLYRVLQKNRPDFKNPSDQSFLNSYLTFIEYTAVRQYSNT